MPQEGPDTPKLSAPLNFRDITDESMRQVKQIGVNNVLIETDVPHPTCIYPGARERLAVALAGLDSHTRRRVLQDNAAELYGISVPSEAR